MTENLKEVFKQSANEELLKEKSSKVEQLKVDSLPPGITYSKGKYRVSKTFLGKNYSFGTIARLHDAKSVNKNVDAIIAFAREKNGDLINENVALKGRVTELEKELKYLELWSLKFNNELEHCRIGHEHLSKENERLKNRNLWQRIWNK